MSSSSASSFLASSLSWLYDHVSLSSATGKLLFKVLPWLFLIYAHVVPDWIKPKGRSNSRSSSSSSSYNTFASNGGFFFSSRPHLTRVQRMRKRLTMNVEKFKSPMKLASGITSIFQKFAQSVGFPHWISFVLFHARFSLIVALYSKFVTKRQHADIFDCHRRRYGKPINPQELRSVMRNVDLADLAYDPPKTVERELAVRGYTLLRHHLIVEPGMPAHYLAVHYDKRELLWGIRGTKSITDVITDIVCEPKLHKIKSPLLQDETKYDERDRHSIYWHEGILAGAYQLTKEVQPLLEQVFLPQGYNLKIVGHSLGGGIASCLGILLLSKIKTFQDDYSRLHVYTFASPNCVGYNAALAHAPIITSVVNNEDFITRFSFENLRNLHNILLKLQERYRDWSIFTFLFWWTKNNRAKLASAVMDYEYVEELATDLQKVDHENGMYIPGKILYVWKLGFEDSHGGQLDGRETDARHPSLRFIQLSKNCLFDHLCDSYKADCNSYVRQVLREQAAASTGSASEVARESRLAMSSTQRELGKFIRSSRNSEGCGGGGGSSHRILSRSELNASLSSNRRESARLIRNAPPRRTRMFYPNRGGGSSTTSIGSDTDSVGGGRGESDKRTSSRSITVKI